MKSQPMTRYIYVVVMIGGLTDHMVGAFGSYDEAEEEATRLGVSKPLVTFEVKTVLFKDCTVD